MQRHKKERRRQAGMVSHGHGRKGVEGVRRTWTLKGHGFHGSYLPSAWVALYRLGDQSHHPVIHTSGMAVASWRLRKKDPVSVSLDRGKEKGRARLSRVMEYVLPNMRPFRGISKSTVDEGGNCTFSVAQPRVFPMLAKYYEVFLPLCSKPGLSVTIRTTATTREEGIHRLARRGFPFKED